MMPAMDDEIIAFLQEHGMFAAALRVRSAFDSYAKWAKAYSDLEAGYHAVRNEALDEAAYEIDPYCGEEACRDDELTEYGRTLREWGKRVRALKSTTSATESHATAPSAPETQPDSGESEKAASEADVAAQTWSYDARDAALEEAAQGAESFPDEYGGKEIACFIRYMKSGRDEKCPHGIVMRECKDCNNAQLAEPIAADWDDWVARDVGK